MVIRNIHPLRWWLAIAVALFVTAISIPIGLTIYYAYQNRLLIQQSQQHACEALGLISSIPAPKPADPTSNPSREANYKFHNAIVHWYNSNNCTGTSAR